MVGEKRFEMGDCTGPANKGKVVLYTDKGDHVGQRCMYAINQGGRPMNVTDRPSECGSCSLSRGTEIGI